MSGDEKKVVEILNPYNMNIMDSILEEEHPIKKKEVILPGTGKLISNFAEEIVSYLKYKNEIFFRSDSMEIVEVGKIKDKEGNELHTGFMIVTPNRFITLIEKHITPGVLIITKYQGMQFKVKSMGSDLSKTCLCSEILQGNIPLINRIFTIPLPIIYGDEVTFPKRGYDERFNSWMPFNAPNISNQDMDLDKAKEIIDELFKEFCFKTEKDKTNAIAGLITPFLRGLFPSFSTRTPLFFYIANRERAGKDYLAGITGILYEGHALEESPISSSEETRNTQNNEELRKKILAALISGRKRMHFSNNKGYINNAVFEAIITAEKYSDRVLGKSEVLTFDNELDFSLSGNTGIGFTPDFANRCRIIHLFLDIEDANSRKFEKPQLHKWVKENRELILSALYSLVKNWINKEKPKGSTPFTSFPVWSEVCGGIMESAGYSSPCEPCEEVLALGGDNETKEMKHLFEISYKMYPDQWIDKNTIKCIVKEEEIFADMDLINDRSAQTRFGNMLIKYIGRVLSDIRLVIENKKVRPSKYRYKLIKDKMKIV